MKYDNFEEMLLQDLAWRKKEISELYLIAKDNKNEVLLKSMILMLYAHWEGYIKNSSKLYIKYISEKKVNISDLTYNFKALVLKLQISNSISSKENLNLSHEIQFMEKYEKLNSKKFKVAIDISNEFDNKIINTHDNLNPKVFKNILNILGVKYLESFTYREHYIDSSLLRNRNMIGHGSKFNNEIQEDFNLCIEDIGKLKQFIIEVLDFYTSMMLDYIIKEFYLAANSENKETYNNIKNEDFNKILKKIEEQEKESIS